MLHVAHVFERAGEFDLIHNQADFVPLAFSRLVATPVVTTIHGFSSERIVPAFKRYEDRVQYVAISDADRRSDLRYAATIHHGIRLEDFPFDPYGSEDLLFFGRIHPDKGAAEAIAAARRAGRRLVMPASSRIRTIIARMSRPHSTTTVPSPISARWAARPARKLWVPRARCSTSSISTSRSDYRSWRRSPAARRSSLPTAARCPS